MRHGRGPPGPNLDTGPADRQASRSEPCVPRWRRRPHSCYTSAMHGEALRTRVFVAAALAGAAHLAFDAVTSRLVWTTPPYLLLDYASETAIS